MIETRTSALARPQNLFDVPAFTVWMLAAAGTASIRLAYALEEVRTRRAARRQFEQRPRARLGPSQSTQTDNLIPDSWRVR